MKNIQTGVQSRIRRGRANFDAIVAGADPREFMVGKRPAASDEELIFPWVLEVGGNGDPMATQFTNDRGGKTVIVHRQTSHPVRFGPWKVSLSARLWRWLLGR